MFVYYMARRLWLSLVVGMTHNRVNGFRSASMGGLSIKSLLSAVNVGTWRTRLL